jgi:hypothetical protein
MSDLSDLLALLHSSEESFTTLSGSLKIWRHLERHDAAFRMDAQRRGLAAEDIGPGFPLLPKESDTIMYLWRVKPDYARLSIGQALGMVHMESGSASNGGAGIRGVGLKAMLKIFPSEAKLDWSFRLCSAQRNY